MHHFYVTFLSSNLFSKLFSAVMLTNPLVICVFNEKRNSTENYQFNIFRCFLFNLNNSFSFFLYFYFRFWRSVLFYALKRPWAEWGNKISCDSGKIYLLITCILLKFEKKKEDWKEKSINAANTSLSVSSYFGNDKKIIICW